MEFTGNKINREAIKSRMLKVAANLWGYPDTVGESNFDPVVGLMLEALASEVEQVYDELQMSQSRVTERLSKMLLPDVLTGPRPAHTIVHAIPTESSFTLKKSVQLFCKQLIRSQISVDKEQSKNIFFSPVADTVLIKGAVKVLATPYQVFKVNNALFKEPVAVSNQTRSENADLELWIGIETTTQLEDLKGVSLFFENKNDTNKKHFYDLLDLCTAKCGRQSVELKRGSYKENSAVQKSWNPNNKVTALLEEELADLYNTPFLHIANSVPLKEAELEVFPKELEGHFTAAQLVSLKNKLIWIKILYPSGLTNKTLSDLQVSINCFPVINRQLLELSYRLQDSLNIIPLSTEDTFLDLLRIYSADRKQYREIPLGTGGYIVRQGSVGRFDSRNANELLAYLLNLLQDESSAFSSMGLDILQNNIKQLTQLINALQQRLNIDATRKDTATFVMVQPQPGYENIYIEYWVSQGLLASGIRQGTALQSYSGSALMSESIYMVRNTSAAEEKLSAAKSINTFKAALLSHGRISTEQDIRYACFAELGDLLEQVNISTTFIKSNKKSLGFEKIILVELVPAVNSMEFTDWELAIEQLQLKLRQHSMQVIPINVIIKTA